MKHDWRAMFEDTYSSPESPTVERIWHEAFGAEYPEGVDPYSYVTSSELHRFVRDLALPAGGRLVDVGCGRGGAGLWVAQAAGARLTGIDIADAPLFTARERARRMGAAADFRRGEFEATGLPVDYADGIMSIDSLLFTPNKAAALVELRRVLKSGGRLAFTSWDYHRQPVGRPPQLADHRPYLETAGFQVLAYEETANWREYGEATDRGLLAAVDQIAIETGESPEELRLDMEEMIATRSAMIRRFFALAQAV
jgi:SAM-dependent methyltransferase